MKFNQSVIDMILSPPRIKIVKFLLTHEASMSGREIASILKKSHMNVNRILLDLAKINFVNYLKVGKAHLWRVNRKSYAYKVFCDFIDRINQMREPRKELKEFLVKKLPKAMIKKIILFGSVAKGDEESDSDVDLFILVENSKIRKKLESFMAGLSNRCIELYGNRLAPYILTENEMKKQKRQKIIKEVAQGIVLFEAKKANDDGKA